MKCGCLCGDVSHGFATVSEIRADRVLKRKYFCSQSCKGVGEKCTERGRAAGGLGAAAGGVCALRFVTSWAVGLTVHHGSVVDNPRRVSVRAVTFISVTSKEMETLFVCSRL